MQTFSDKHCEVFSWHAATRSSAGGFAGTSNAPMMPPTLEHGWLPVDRRHRVDTLRRVIHSLNSQRALVFMNFGQRLKVRVPHAWQITCLIQKLPSGLLQYSFTPQTPKGPWSV